MLAGAGGHRCGKLAPWMSLAFSAAVNQALPPSAGHRVGLEQIRIHCQSLTIPAHGVGMGGHTPPEGQGPPDPGTHPNAERGAQTLQERLE